MAVAVGLLLSGTTALEGIGRIRAVDVAGLPYRPEVVDGGAVGGGTGGAASPISAEQ